jgi:predicted nucleic acid-binding protein
MAEADKEAACREVLQAAEAGRVTIVTSALTIAEVLALRGRTKVPASTRASVEAFFRSDYIIVRNITRRIAEKAREHVWDNRIAPKDALHVATAIDAGLTLLNTFDEGLLKHNGSAALSGLGIQKPAFIEPRIPGL